MNKWSRGAVWKSKRYSELEAVMAGPDEWQRVNHRQAMMVLNGTIERSQGYSYKHMNKYFIFTGEFKMVPK